MGTLIIITAGQLLKNVHISKLQLIVFVDVVMKPRKEPVLVKIVVDDLFAEIDKYLIGKDK